MRKELQPEPGTSPTGSESASKRWNSVGSHLSCLSDEKVKLTRRGIEGVNVGERGARGKFDIESYSTNCVADFPSCPAVLIILPQPHVPLPLAPGGEVEPERLFLS